ncbi:MAG: Mur ligase family protein, partial [Acidimicrobiales bacterium]
ALAAGGPVVSNPSGANLPAGLVAALAGARQAQPGRTGAAGAPGATGAPGALEVDEAWLGHVAAAVAPVAMALLNLSRDQLDRVSEVRRLGASWRKAVAGSPHTHVVANADDPIVAWAASAAARVTWVAAGQPWRLDASACPRCEARIAFDGERWACASCGLGRPEPAAWLDGRSLALADGRRLPFGLALPGRFNRANAAVAAVTAEVMGVPLPRGLEAMGAVADVAGRYQVVETRAGGEPVAARLLLAKNPAGWVELFDVLAPPPAPVVLAINARVADGRDPSWLWDVPFERLAGRPTVATGERRRDLAVRLRYAGVDHEVRADPLAALVAAARPADDQAVDVVANYTAFQDLRRAVGRSGRRAG